MVSDESRVNDSQGEMDVVPGRELTFLERENLRVHPRVIVEVAPGSRRGLVLVRAMVRERENLLSFVAVELALAFAVLVMSFVFLPLALPLGGLLLLSLMGLTDRAPSQVSLVEVECPVEASSQVMMHLSDLLAPLSYQFRLNGGKTRSADEYLSLLRWIIPYTSLSVRVGSTGDGGTSSPGASGLSWSSWSSVARRGEASSEVGSRVALPYLDEVGAFARRRGDVPGKNVALSLLRLHGLGESLSPGQVQRLETLMGEFLEVTRGWDALRSGPFAPSPREVEYVEECFELLRLPVERLEREFLEVRRGGVESRIHYLSGKYGALGESGLSLSEGDGEDGDAMERNGGE